MSCLDIFLTIAGADYTNTFYSSYMPILSSDVFDNNAHTYNVSRILTPQFLFDEKAYKSYSKVFMPITLVPLRWWGVHAN